MKLTVRRSQSADSKGVIRFRADFTLETSSEEGALIDKYRQKDLVLGRVDPISSGSAVKAFLTGSVTYESDSVLKMLAVEEKVKEDAEKLSALIVAAGAYDGAEELFSTEL